MELFPVENMSIQYYAPVNMESHSPLFHPGKLKMIETSKKAKLKHLTKYCLSFAIFGHSVLSDGHSLFIIVCNLFLIVHYCPLQLIALAIIAIVCHTTLFVITHCL